MTTSPNTTPHETTGSAAALTDGFCLVRNPDETNSEYRARIQRLFPLDVPMYQQEAALDFAEKHGLYPPILVIDSNPEAFEEWHDTLMAHREKHGLRTVTKQIAEHHDLITARLAAGATANEIAAELNCRPRSLRGYLRGAGLQDN